MEIVTNNLRQIATLRVSEKAYSEDTEQLIIHELVHIVLDQLRREYLTQAKRLPPNLQKEYIARYEIELEKVVEHLSLVLYDM